MIHVLELLIGALFNLGAAALVPIGLFLWLIWFFLKLYVGESIRIHRKYRGAVKDAKKTQKSLDNDLIKLGIDPKEFNKLPELERWRFWRNISDEELQAHGISTDFDLR